MTLEERLVQVERRCKIYSRLVCLLCVAGGGLVLAGAYHSSEPVDLRVKSLEVIDQNGTVRLRLGDVSKGEGVYGAVISDATGAAHVSLFETADLRMSAGKSLIMLNARKSHAMLSLTAPVDSNDGVTSLLYAKEGLAGFQIRDSEGKVTQRLETPKENAGKSKREVPSQRVDPFSQPAK